MFLKKNAELKEHPNRKELLLWSKDGYNYSTEQLEGDSGIASAYGIKKTFSCHRRSST